MNKFTLSLILTFYFCLLTFNLSFAQIPEWVYQYVHPDAFGELPAKIAVDSLGNTYTTGVVSSDDTTGGHITGIAIIKLNTLGEEKWIYFNDTLGRLTEGYDIALKNSKVYATGYTGPSPSNRPVFIVLCVDTSGQGQWVYKDTIAIRGNAIGVSSLHMVYAVGLTFDYDIVCIKLDSLGNERWRYVYDGPGSSYDQAKSLGIDRDENIYVGGYSTGVSTSEDFTVIKLDSAGNEQWVYRYDGPAHAYDVCGVLLDTTGYIYAVGTSAGIGLDYCVIKLDSSGQEKWIYRYNGSANGDDYLGGCAVDDSGNIYVSGSTWRIDDRYLFTVVKIDSLGNERWCYLNSGPVDMGGSGGPTALDGLSGVYVSGHFRNVSNRMQIAVVKFNPAGDTQWLYIHPHIPPSPFHDGSRSIVADINSNVYLTGKICVSSFDDDIVVMKFASSQGMVKEVMHENIGISNIASILRSGIEFVSQKDVSLEIYDITGRLIVRQTLYKGSKYFCSLPSGVYFLRLNSEGRTEGKKVIIL